MSLRFYYFNSTHWDREWYLPFESFRRYLVTTADEILRDLESGRLDKYTFDGQTVVLEDILEICPEWRKRFENVIKSGKLNVGPWYVMADEFLASGEALIRNLLMGTEVAIEFGHEPWRVGYICDIFGHIAQMPQIFNGFGLAPAVLWRGMEADQSAFFYWQSPDGSKCPALRLPGECGYGAFTLKVTGWWNDPVSEAEFKENLTGYVKTLHRQFGSSIVLSDALDHMPVHSQVKDYLRWIKECYPDSTVIHSDFRDMAEEYNNSTPVVSGELIATCRDAFDSTTMIPHTLSSRYDVKRANDRCQDMLETSCEPLLVAGMRTGSAGAMLPFWKYAWKTLLKNHAHDSICGCSTDAVHRQVLLRYEAVEQVCSEIVNHHLLLDREQLTDRTVTSDAADGVHADRQKKSDTSVDGRYTVRIYNPLPWSRREVLELNLKFPSDQEYPERWGEPFLYETFPNFHIYDESGAEVNYQLGKVRRNTQSRFYRADVRLKDVIPVTLKTELRASGWTTLTVVPEKKRPRCFLSQLAGLRSAENKFLRLTVNADGSLDIFDKRTSRNYPDCHTFLIDREIGDGWNHIRPAGFPELRQGVSVKSIAVTTDGPARTTFEIIREMELPAELEFKGTLTEHYAGIEESRDTVTLKIKSLVSLDADSPYVKITTELNNTLRDYRLRMVLPTSIPGKYFAYQNFTFLQREPGRATGRLTEGYWETEPLEKNFSGIAGKRDADGGIALVSRYGLHELSASEFSSGELFFTLLRAFRRTIFTDGEPEGQLPGVLKFEYSLCPLAATDDNAALYRYSLEYRSQAPSYMLPESVAAEPESWFTLDGDLSLSALKPAQNMAEKQAVLRLINYHGESAEGKLKFSTPVRLSEVNLDESEIMVEPLEGTEFIVSARPDQLKTYRIEF